MLIRQKKQRSKKTKKKIGLGNSLIRSKKDYSSRRIRGVLFNYVHFDNSLNDKFLENFQLFVKFIAKINFRLANKKEN